eukprot:490255_1
MKTKTLYHYIHSVLHSQIEYPTILLLNSTNKYDFTRLRSELDFDMFMELKYIRLWIDYLYIHNNNLLYNILNDQWMGYWKLYLICPNYKQATYIKNNPLFKIIKVIKKYGIDKLMRFDQHSFLHDHGSIRKYINTINAPPHYIKYIEGNYNEYDEYNNDEYTIFATPDGSIKNYIGGVGYFMEFHTPNDNEKMSIDSQTLLYLISITDEYNTDPEYSLARFAPPNLPYRIIELQQAQLHIISDNDNAIDWLTLQQQIAEPAK